MFNPKEAKSIATLMQERLRDLSKAWVAVNEIWDDTYFSLDDFNNAMVDNYPFEKSFDEYSYPIIDWVNQSIKNLNDVKKGINTMDETKLISDVLSGKSVKESLAVTESSEESTRKQMVVAAKNMIAMLNEFVKFVQDSDNDLVDISFEVEKITREEGHLQFLLDNCDEY